MAAPMRSPLRPCNLGRSAGSFSPRSVISDDEGWLRSRSSARRSPLKLVEAASPAAAVVEATAAPDESKSDDPAASASAVVPAAGSARPDVEADSEALASRFFLSTSGTRYEKANVSDVIGMAGLKPCDGSPARYIEKQWGLFEPASFALAHAPTRAAQAAAAASAPQAAAAAAPVVAPLVAPPAVPPFGPRGLAPGTTAAHLKERRKKLYEKLKSVRITTWDRLAATCDEHQSRATIRETAYGKLSSNHLVDGMIEDIQSTANFAAEMLPTCAPGGHLYAWFLEHLMDAATKAVDLICATEPPGYGCPLSSAVNEARNLFISRCQMKLAHAGPHGTRVLKRLTRLGHGLIGGLCGRAVEPTVRLIMRDGLGMAGICDDAGAPMRSLNLSVTVPGVGFDLCGVPDAAVDDARGRGAHVLVSGPLRAARLAEAQQAAAVGVKEDTVQPLVCEIKMREGGSTVAKPGDVAQGATYAKLAAIDTGSSRPPAALLAIFAPKRNTHGAAAGPGRRSALVRNLRVSVDAYGLANDPHATPLPRAKTGMPSATPACHSVGSIPVSADLLERHQAADPELALTLLTPAYVEWYWQTLTAPRLAAFVKLVRTLADGSSAASLQLRAEWFALRTCTHAEQHAWYWRTTGLSPSAEGHVARLAGHV